MCYVLTWCFRESSSSPKPLLIFSGSEKGHFVYRRSGWPCLAEVMFCSMAQNVTVRQMKGGPKKFPPHELIKVAWDHILQPPVHPFKYSFRRRPVTYVIILCTNFTICFPMVLVFKNAYEMRERMQYVFPDWQTPSLFWPSYWLGPCRELAYYVMSV